MYIHILFMLETGKGYTCRLCNSKYATELEGNTVSQESEDLKTQSVSTGQGSL